MALVGLSVWIFLSPLLAISVCVVAKCCILTHKSWVDKYGNKDEGTFPRLRMRENRETSQISSVSRDRFPSLTTNGWDFSICWRLQD